MPELNGCEEDERLGRSIDDEECDREEERLKAAAEARLLSIKEKLEGGGELTEVEMSDAAAILELREIWAQTAQQWATLWEMESGQLKEPQMAHP